MLLMSGFSDKDKGWNRLMTSFKINAGETAGFVGYLRSSGNYKPKPKKGSSEGSSPAPAITMAQLAAVHEYGAPEQNIPERSFIRSTLAEHSKDIKRLQKKVTNSIISGKLNKKQAIGILCHKITDGIVAKIESNIPPPLEEETIRRKGSSTALIDTGQLKNSVDWEVKEGK
jgi:hypothetical protein